MSNLVTFETIHFVTFLDTLLREENGISEQAYREIHLLLRDRLPELSHELTKTVDATDGRFYIVDAVPHLTSLLYEG